MSTLSADEAGSVAVQGNVSASARSGVCSVMTGASAAASLSAGSTQTSGSASSAAASSAASAAASAAAPFSRQAFRYGGHRGGPGGGACGPSRPKPSPSAVGAGRIAADFGVQRQAVPPGLRGVAAVARLTSPPRRRPRRRRRRLRLGILACLRLAFVARRRPVRAPWSSESRRSSLDVFLVLHRLLDGLIVLVGSSP